MDYQKKVKAMKALQIFLIAFGIISLVTYSIFISRPTVTAYAVKDECGTIGGQVSHPIDDLDACVNVCNAHCKSLNQEYHDSSFVEAEIGCNLCNCECKN